MACAGDHAHRNAVRHRELRDFVALDVAVPRGAHLVLGRQVEPQLEPFHAAVFLFGELGVHDAAPGGHPLHAAVREQSFVAGAVAMTHAAGDHVRHRFNAAMRVVRKSADVVLRIVGAKRVEHQERIELALQRLCQHACQFHARAVGGRLTRDQPLDVARTRHGFGWELQRFRRHLPLLACRDIKMLHGAKVIAIKQPAPPRSVGARMPLPRSPLPRPLQGPRHTRTRCRSCRESPAPS